MAHPDPVGRAIKRARERRRMTQRDLAQAVGVDVKTVGNWERGRVGGIRNRIGALEEALGVSLSGDEEQSPVIPPDLERRLEQLTPEERDYVVGMLTQPGASGEAPAREGQA